MAEIYVFYIAIYRYIWKETAGKVYYFWGMALGAKGAPDKWLLFGYKPLKTTLLCILWVIMINLGWDKAKRNKMANTHPYLKTKFSWKFY